MNWLQTLGPTILVVIGGIISWLLKSKYEEFRNLKEKLHEDQRQIYRKILDPYIRLFAESKDKDTGIAHRQLLSYEFRKIAFDFNLIGSDNAILAYNKLMQHVYKSEKQEGINGKELMRLWGELLLEIRKSLGNKRTKLNEYDMLEGMIKDIEELKKK